MRGLVMERESIVFKFEGDLEEISVETFTMAVMGYSKLLQMAASKVEPSMRLDVVISGTRPGCFEAQLAAVATDVGGVVASLLSTSGSVGNAISAVKSYLELRKFLAEGGAPKEVRTKDGVSQVINNNGTMVVNNYVIKLEADDEAARTARGMYQTLAGNGAVSGFKVSGPGGSTFESGRSDLERLQSVPRCEVENTRVETWHGKTLAVVSPVLEQGERKWQFVMDGFKVSAAVTDAEMYAKLESHEWSFGIGDYVKADVEVTQRKTRQGIWENVSYRVVRVHDVINGASEQRLF